MKKGLKITLILCLILFCVLTASVFLMLRGKFFDGYYLFYEMNHDQESCTITKCISFGAKEIVVPDTIGQYPVTKIGDYAFANCKKLTSVSLPYGIVSIGMGAFYECEHLTNINIPQSVTVIDSYAFYNCKSLTSISLSENVAKVGTRVFEGCTKMTSATIPTLAIDALPAENITHITVNGGTAIGNYAFQNFQNLTSITLSPSIEKIGIGAFAGCNNITFAAAHAEVISSIPKNKLTHIVINGGTCIKEKSLQYCSYLTCITLPQSITSIGDFAFLGCQRLVEIYNLSPLEITKGSPENGGIGRYALQIYTSTEETSKTWIDQNEFLFYEDTDGCYLLGYMGTETELTLPSSCHGKEYFIRESAFYVDSGITAITIPDGVLKIEKYAFAHCTGLTSITIPDSLVAIGDYAFFECDALTHVSLGKNIAAIGAFAFDECYNLESISFKGTVAEWKQVHQGDYWIDYTPAKELVCLDGIIPLK